MKDYSNYLPELCQTMVHYRQHRSHSREEHEWLVEVQFHGHLVK